jgi:hypothetical protein
MEIIKSSYHPVESLENKENYKIYYSIDTQGKTRERILLDISDQRLRENIILSHFLQFYNRISGQKIVDIKILGRDDPWDFKLKINDGSIINIEITSISSSPHHFRKLKVEETYKELMMHEYIRIRDLIKINKLSPDFNFDETINNGLASGKKNDDYIKNPIYKRRNIWLSVCGNIETMTDVLTKAINAKESKKHSDKDNTILIIDNRSIHYEIDNFNEFLNTYQDKSSFKEIWLYTGYYSDISGIYCEFDISPIKIDENQFKILYKTVKDEENQVNGINYIRADNRKETLLKE